MEEAARQGPRDAVRSKPWDIHDASTSLGVLDAPDAANPGRGACGDIPSRPGGCLLSLPPASVAGPSLTLPEVTRTLATVASPWKGTWLCTEWKPRWRPRRGHPRGPQASGQQGTQRPQRTPQAAALEAPGGPPGAHPAAQPRRHRAPPALTFPPRGAGDSREETPPWFPLFLQKVSFCQRDTFRWEQPFPAPPLPAPRNCLPACSGSWVGQSLSSLAAEGPAPPSLDQKQKVGLLRGLCVGGRGKEASVSFHGPGVSPGSRSSPSFWPLAPFIPASRGGDSLRKSLATAGGRAAPAGGSSPAPSADAPGSLALAIPSQLVTGLCTCRSQGHRRRGIQGL